MPDAFAEKLILVMKTLSLTRGGLAGELGVDKSIVGRWVRGIVTPSTYNLSRLTALADARFGGFRLIDWERDLADLEEFLGVPSSSSSAPKFEPLPQGLPIHLMSQIFTTSDLWAAAYEGYFRSTRPYAQYPGRFVHDQIMIRRDEYGLLAFDMLSGGVRVRGWALMLQTQLFVVASELTSGALAFAILNGVNGVKAGVLDGIALNCALDVSRSPTASAIIIERTGDLIGNREADDAYFATLAELDPLAPAGSVPEQVVSYLVRDIGPTPLASGGDWLLTLPLARSIARGLPPE